MNKKKVFLIGGIALLVVLVVAVFVIAGKNDNSDDDPSSIISDVMPDAESPSVSAQYGYEDVLDSKITDILMTGAWQITNGAASDNSIVFTDDTLILSCGGENYIYSIIYTDPLVNGNLSKVSVEISELVGASYPHALQETSGVLTMSQTSSSILIQSSVLPTSGGQTETMWTQKLSEELIAATDIDKPGGEAVIIDVDDYVSGQWVSPHEGAADDPFSDYYVGLQPGDVDPKTDKTVKEAERTISADGSSVTVKITYEDGSSRTQTVTRTITYNDDREKVEIDYPD